MSAANQQKMDNNQQSLSDQVAALATSVQQLSGVATAVRSEPPGAGEEQTNHNRAARRAQTHFPLCISRQGQIRIDHFNAQKAEEPTAMRGGLRRRALLGGPCHSTMR